MSWAEALASALQSAVQAQQSVSQTTTSTISTAAQPPDVVLSISSGGGGSEVITQTVIKASSTTQNITNTALQQLYQVMLKAIKVQEQYWNYWKEIVLGLSNEIAKLRERLSNSWEMLANNLIGSITGLIDNLTLVFSQGFGLIATTLLSVFEFKPEDLAKGMLEGYKRMTELMFEQAKQMR